MLISSEHTKLYDSSVILFKAKNVGEEASESDYNFLFSNS